MSIPVVRPTRLIVAAMMTFSLLVCSGCGSGSSISQSTGPLNGNWQLNLVENFPRKTQLSVSGFLVESKSSLTGTFQVPAIALGSTTVCGGTGPLTGTMSESDVTFSIDPGGTTLSFNGTIASDNASMTGSYQALAGACFVRPASGTWTASLIPPLNGNFVGTLSGSKYMAALTGMDPPAPISVSGSFSQSPTAGGSTASITGTITAVGYPCFRNAFLSGTISGESVYLGVFDFNGLQIGTLGVPGLPGVAGTPAVVSGSSQGTTLTGDGQAGLSLGNTGNSPCPALQENGISLTKDTTSVALTIQ